MKESAPLQPGKCGHQRSEMDAEDRAKSMAVVKRIEPRIRWRINEQHLASAPDQQRGTENRGHALSASPQLMVGPRKSSHAGAIAVNKTVL